MFVSIHVNQKSADNHPVSDYIIYTSPTNIRAKESSALATSIAGSMAPYKPVLGNKGLLVLKQSTHPAVLIECGNIDKPDQVQSLQDSKKLDELCKSILSGIAAYADGN
jgi:N-acetylmuramoyl-L-alanine amidase